jgi:hypothetical protein
MRRFTLLYSLFFLFSLLSVFVVTLPAYADLQVPPCGKGTQGNRFVLLDNGASVCDNTSGLLWERRPANVVKTFADATAYCIAKGQGWTVPGIKDFFTVVDYAAANPPLPSGHPFEIPVNGEYWSRTSKVGSSDEVWSFVLDFGRTFNASKSGTTDYVWCVRY